MHILFDMNIYSYIIVLSLLAYRHTTCNCIWMHPRTVVNVHQRLAAIYWRLAASISHEPRNEDAITHITITKQHQCLTLMTLFRPSRWSSIKHRRLNHHLLYQRRKNQRSGQSQNDQSHSRSRRSSALYQASHDERSYPCGSSPLLKYSHRPVHRARLSRHQGRLLRHVRHQR